MKSVYLHLSEVALGELTVESIRGHEAWRLRLSEEWLAKPRAMIDPNGRSPAQSRLSAAGEGVPLLFAHRTATGRTAFLALPPTVVRRSDFRENFTWGQDTVSKEMSRALGRAIAALAPAPSVSTERGEISAVVTAKGGVVAVIEEVTPLYNDATAYPVSFRFTVSAPGIGRSEIEADAPYAVIAREADRLVLRAETKADTGNFFRFAKPQ